MLQTTLLTSAWSAYKYLNQYLFGISKLKSISDQLDITLAFGSVSDVYDDKDHEDIRQSLQTTCDEAGIKLHFYRGDKSENFYQTINLLIAQTIGFTENYSTYNLDDLVFGDNLLARIKTLETSQVTYSDFICTNDVIKAYDAYKSGDLLKYAGIFCKHEETWSDVDMSNKEKYYKEFRWSCFTTVKAATFARIGVFDETYKSAGDFDFINRCIFHSIKPVKTPGVAGLFLAVGEGISTKPNSPGIMEGYKTLERYIGNKHPVATFYNRKHLWRNL